MTEPTPEVQPDAVQVFAEGSYADGTLAWGWQCFRCDTEEFGYGTATTAQDGADVHATECIWRSFA